MPVEEKKENKDAVYFGRVNFRNSNHLFGIKRTDRRQHMYVIGKTGTGKTALLYNLVIQDIAAGEGVCVIDPHGELVENLLTKIPKERIKDVIYFNPADPDFHIGFNILELQDPKYKHLVASGLMGIFTKIWSNVWSARMEYILNNAVLALLDTPGSTLLGISRLLVDREYRRQIIENIQDPVVKAFWINEYEEWRDQFRNEAIAPIQNKVGQFLSSSLIRNIVGQSKSTINIFDIMNSGKIFLVNVSKGRIGEDNAALLGAMLITKMQLSAMERVRIPEDERVDFFLYVDEFQNFATDSFANILSEARKYRLNLILAHQYIGQLVTDVSTKVRDAVFGNVGTIVAFRVGAQDAEFLEKEFSPEFTAQDLINLPNYHICLKLMVDGVTSRPFSAVTLPPFQVTSNEASALEIINSSRKFYAVPRYLVEAEINNWSGMVGEKDLLNKVSNQKILLKGSVFRTDILEKLGISSNGSQEEKNKIKRLKKDKYQNEKPYYQKTYSEQQSKSVNEGIIKQSERENIEQSTISLSELKNSDFYQRLKNKNQIGKSNPIDIEELRKALRKSLKELDS